jgi:TRAP-type C4-dicarboxylate transport system substrate-binding protein
MQVQRIWEEELVPIAEHMPALRDGIFDLYYTWQGYPAGLMPVLNVVSFGEYIMPSNEAWWVLHEKFGLKETLAAEYAKFNAYFVASTSYEPGAYLVSREPVPTIDDLKGKKLRVAGDIEPKVLEDLGAGSIWMPGGEVYTALASGLVDGAIYGSLADYYAMGWHEVAKYWILPPRNDLFGDTVTANMDFWNSLSEGDRWLITTIGEAAGLVHTRACHYDSAEALEIVVREHGVIIQTWDEESHMRWKALLVKHAPEPADAASEKAMEQVLAAAAFYGIELD